MFAPPFEVVVRDHLEERLVARTPLFERHREGMRDRGRDRLRIVGIDQQRRRELGRRACKARQDENAGILWICAAMYSFATRFMPSRNGEPARPARNGKGRRGRAGCKRD